MSAAFEWLARARFPGNESMHDVYQAVLSRYRTEPEPFWGGAFRVFIDALVTLLQWRQGIEFPGRNVGEWWWTSRWRLEILLRWYDRDSIAFCRRLLRRGMVVVDVGAHMGYYTRLCAELVGREGQVLALEPHPENLAVLRRNTWGHRYQNVQISGAAAGEIDREAQLHWSAGSTNHSLVSGFTPCVHQSGVTVRSLDALLADFGFTRVDFVKIDVEGAEPRVLSGLETTIALNPQLTILIECNAKALTAAGGSPEKLLAQLAGFEFQVRTLQADGTAGPAPIPDRVELENWVCWKGRGPFPKWYC
jgi:FkbM family methyltransferase